MSRIITFKCLDIEFDYFSSERIDLSERKGDYYITPKRLAKIEAWRINSNIQAKIQTKEDLEFLIQNDWISKY